MKLNKKNLCIGLLVVMILVVGVLGGCSQANDRNLKGATEVGGVEETQDGVMKEKVGGDVEVVEKNEEGESNKKIDLGWGYEKDNDFVFYANKKIEGADLETFEPLESFIVGAMYDTYIFKDKHSVYLRGHKISYADPDTFEVLGGGYSKDGVSVYYIDKRISKADAYSFKVAFDQEGKREFFDKAFYYCYGIPSKEIGKQEVELMPNCFYSKNEEEVFYKMKKIPYADPDTFEVLGGGYSKDGVSVYYITEKVEGADSKTLELIYYPGPGYETVDYAKDKNHVYFKGEIKPELDASTFEF